MASAKTSTFYIREDFDVGSSITTTAMDLSLYVDPVNKQGLLVRNVDFIWHNSSTKLPVAASAFQAAIQVHDSVLGTLADLDSQHQVASGSLTGTTSGVDADQDFFPDRLGMTKGEGRIIVNDTLEIATDANTSVTNLACCVVLECQVIKLSEKDYIALALQSVADA
tara:strand:- start:2647 stop:3147 length:501 start_codon:yes stop_codon:yes gene_type:complete